jgi:hypothetical protein
MNLTNVSDLKIRDGDLQLPAVVLSNVRSNKNAGKEYFLSDQSENSARLFSA